MDDIELVKLADKARENSYTPYSHFTVGAALLTQDGTLYTGCNIENASYTPSNCAERTAIFKAVSEGQRSFSAIAIVGGREGEPAQGFCAPCGVCRQVMHEFCDLDSFRIILGTSDGSTRVFTLGELFPESFGADNIA